MISQILHELDSTTELLQYFTGTTASTQTTRKYAATGIGTGLTAGDKVVIAGFSNSASNGTFTLQTVAADEITVCEAIGANETGITATVTQEYQGAWVLVERWSKLVGVINTSGAAIIYIDQSGDGGNNTDYTSSWAVTAATAFVYSAEIIAKYARLRIRTNAADQTTMRAYLYGRANS
jgi:hypothetical protein